MLQKRQRKILGRDLDLMEELQNRSSHQGQFSAFHMCDEHLCFLTNNPKIENQNRRNSLQSYFWATPGNRIILSLEIVA